MRDLFTLFLHAIVIIIRLGRPGGLRSVVAESVLMRHQILILNRGRKRAPNLRPTDRIIAGLCTLLTRPARVLWSAVALKPSTLIYFHRMLTKQKYRLLFSSTGVRRPGPKGPSKELIDAVVEMKRRNRIWGCKRIAQQMALAFGIEIDKDVVRRILGIHFQPEAGSGGPSWLSFIGHTKRLAVVLGSVSMRIGDVTNLLGSGRDGSIYAADRRLCRSPRCYGWRGIMQDVQSSHSYADPAKVSQFRS